MQAVLLHQRVNRVEIGVAQPVRAVPNRMGDFARHLALRDGVRHPAQVFKEHDAQRCWQGPKFAQPQFTAVLVGIDKRRENLGVEDAVGVSHIGPGDAIDAWQSFQRRGRQLGQAVVVAARHAFVDLLQLCFDQVEIVKQPLGGGCHIMAAARSQRYIIVGIAQRGEVLLNARKKGGAAARAGIGFDHLGLRQTAAVLFEALDAEQFSANGRLGFTPARQKDIAGVRG